MIATKGDFKQQDNRAPHSTKNIDNIKRRLTAKEFTAYERAERCHTNSLENMPLFVSAVFAGLLAEQRAGKGRVGVDAFVVGSMVIRVLYTINYIKTETMRWSYVRTALYNAGVLWAFYVIGRAAFIVGA